MSPKALGKPVPDDWDEQQDGYLDFWGQVPNSAMWRGYLRGAAYGLTDKWDESTGDAQVAGEIGTGIYDSLNIGNLPVGATDHGELVGLGDDDHPQYHNDARGDSRYYTQSLVDGFISGRYGPDNDFRGKYGWVRSSAQQNNIPQLFYQKVNMNLVSGTAVTVSNNNMYVASTGLYLMMGGIVCFPNGANIYTNAYVELNGVLTFGTSRGNTSFSTVHFHPIVAALNAGDQLALYVYFSGGGSTNYIQFLGNWGGFLVYRLS